MEINPDKIKELQYKLEQLQIKQNEFSKEISKLKTDIELLSMSQGKSTDNVPVVETKRPEPIIRSILSERNEQQKAASKITQKTQPKEKSDLEKFIGENLISKIGIIITVIGISIGAKYAIDKELINPLTRILLGYLAGGILLGFAIKLKPKYESFSAVIISGSWAVMYFITFAAYSYYELISQTIAFLLMIIFTVLTVLSAIKYNRQIIAQIGLVGAYAIPILLSDGSGKIAVMFSYITIINIGILFVAIKKYWKPLYYSSFALTWLIYSVWYFAQYNPAIHFSLAFLFATIFYITFYITFIIHKLLNKEKYNANDIILLLTNAFVFYSIGFNTLNNPDSSHLLGTFTLANGITHLIVCIVFYRQKLADKNLFYLTLGLMLVFITIAIPVQISGSWITLLWAGEAAILFWIGRQKSVPFYERLSYLLMVLAFFGLLSHWSASYFGYNTFNKNELSSPLFNIDFLTSILFIAVFTFINFINLKTNTNNGSHTFKLFKTIIPAILIISVYFTFRIEISKYFNQMLAYNNHNNAITENTIIRHYSTIWTLNYSVIFTSLLGIINIQKIKSQQLTYISSGLIMLAVIVFLFQGLYRISELRSDMLNQNLALNKYFFVRYISILFIVLPLYTIYIYLKKGFLSARYQNVYQLVVHVVILWVASSELISWLDIANSKSTYKLGLSILWGIYSLILIIIGIIRKNQFLRFAAIGLFAITLLKLFLYDISHLNTISKTVVFVSLGVLLLIISFLYNKYKHIINESSKE